MTTHGGGNYDEEDNSNPAGDRWPPYRGDYRQGDFHVDLLVAPIENEEVRTSTCNTLGWCIAPGEAVERGAARSWQRRRWLIAGRKNEKALAGQDYRETEQRACFLGRKHPKDWGELIGTTGRREDERDYKDSRGIWRMVARGPEDAAHPRDTAVGGHIPEHFDSRKTGTWRPTWREAGAHGAQDKTYWTSADIEAKNDIQSVLTLETPPLRERREQALPQSELELRMQRRQVIYGNGGESWFAGAAETRSPDQHPSGQHGGDSQEVKNKDEQKHTEGLGTALECRRDGRINRSGSLPRRLQSRCSARVQVDLGSLPRRKKFRNHTRRMYLLPVIHEDTPLL